MILGLFSRRNGNCLLIYARSSVALLISLCIVYSEYVISEASNVTF